MKKNIHLTFIFFNGKIIINYYLPFYYFNNAYLMNLKK